MSIQEQLEGVDIDEAVSDIVRGTIPGESNQPYTEGIINASAVVPVVIEDLNNWFEIIEVRILSKNHISIPMRYRWSIVRWANQDMDGWLQDNGWEDLAHLNADTRLRNENELEARYRKEFGSVTVDCNFLVLFPNRVINKMNGDEVGKAKRKKRKNDKRTNTLKDVIEARRKKDV